MRLTKFLRRALVAAGLASILAAPLAQAATTFIVPQGGTGRSTFTSNAIIKGNGTGALAPSGVSIDSSNNVTGAANLTQGTDTFTVGPTASAAKYLTDGTADDVQINQALTACAASSACRAVKLLAGTFTIADVITLPSGVSLVGSGSGYTTVKAVDAYNPPSTPSISGLTDGRIMLYANAIADNTISDITWDQNVQNIPGLTNNTHARAMYIVNATDLRILRNKLVNTIHYMINVWDSDRVWIEGNTLLGGYSSTYVNNDGILVAKTSDVFIRGNYVDTNAGGGTSGDSGIVCNAGVTVGATYSNCVITDNVISSRIAGVELVVDKAYLKNAVVANNVIWYARAAGIIVHKYTDNTVGQVINATIDGNSISNYGVSGNGAITVVQETSVAEAVFYQLNITNNTCRTPGATSVNCINVVAKGTGLVISNNNVQDFTGNVAINVGGSSRPVKDYVIANNTVDFSLAASSARGISVYGGERGVIAGNNLSGHTTGTTYCIYLTANATAGNDNDGVPNLETSAYQNVTGNECANVDNGVAEVNAGANPDNNRFMNNQFNGVATPYTVLGTNTITNDFDGTNWALSKATLAVGKATTNLGIFTNSTSSSSTQGAGVILRSDDGAAMASGDRLGILGFGGNNSAGSPTSSGVSSFASEGWSGSVNGSDLRLETTLNGSASRSAKVTVSGGGQVSLTPASYSGAPGASGQALSVSTSTFTDSATAGSGTAALFASSSFAAPTLAAANSTVTTTNAATLYVDSAPIKGANNTATAAHGILVAAGSVGAHTASYGLTVNAQSGATANYAAQFLGGNVGIGESAPANQLQVTATNAGAETVLLRLKNNSTTTSTASAIAFNNTTSTSTTAKISAIRTASGGDNDLVFSVNNSSSVLTERFRITAAGSLVVNKTVTAGGTTGAQTIDKPAGSVNFAASATSLVVTDALVTASSVILCTVATNDATMTGCTAVAGSGSFTLRPTGAAPTAETRVNFLVIN